MHSSHQGPPDTSRGFEQSDLSVSGIVKGVVFYFIFTGAVGLVVLIYLWSIGVAHDKRGQELGVQRVPASPNPLLQNNTTARTDLWILRARENYLLTTPTFVDAKHTTARIPIDEAIDKAASMGPSSLKSEPGGPAEGSANAAPAKALGQSGSLSAGQTPLTIENSPSGQNGTGGRIRP